MSEVSPGTSPSDQPGVRMLGGVAVGLLLGELITLITKPTSAMTPTAAIPTRAYLRFWCHHEGVVVGPTGVEVGVVGVGVGPGVGPVVLEPDPLLALYTPQPTRKTQAVTARANTHPLAVQEFIVSLH